MYGGEGKPLINSIKVSKKDKKSPSGVCRHFIFFPSFGKKDEKLMKTSTRRLRTELDSIENSFFSTPFSFFLFFFFSGHLYDDLSLLFSVFLSQTMISVSER